MHQLSADAKESRDNVDFLVTGDEVNPLIRSLRAGDIDG